MIHETASSSPECQAGDGFTPGQLAEIACLLEVTARKPGNVHRFADLRGLRFAEFLFSAAAVREPLEQAVSLGVGAAVLGAVENTRASYQPTPTSESCCCWPRWPPFPRRKISPLASSGFSPGQRSPTPVWSIARSAWQSLAGWGKSPTRT